MNQPDAFAGVARLLLQLADRRGLGGFVRTSIAVDQACRQFDNATAHWWSVLLDVEDLSLRRQRDDLHRAFRGNHTLHEFPAAAAHKPQESALDEGFGLGFSHGGSIGKPARNLCGRPPTRAGQPAAADRIGVTFSLRCTPFSDQSRISIRPSACSTSAVQDSTQSPVL